jgi:hypothetical protein
VTSRPAGANRSFGAIRPGSSTAVVALIASPTGTTMPIEPVMISNSTAWLQVPQTAPGAPCEW